MQQRNASVSKKEYKSSGSLSGVSTTNTRNLHINRLSNASDAPAHSSGAFGLRVTGQNGGSAMIGVTGQGMNGNSNSNQQN